MWRRESIQIGVSGAAGAVVKDLFSGDVGIEGHDEAGEEDGDGCGPGRNGEEKGQVIGD